MLSGIFNALKKNKETTSADIAKDRLQIVIASNRQSDKMPYLRALEEEIMQVIKKYIQVDECDMEVRVDTDKDTGLEVLEVNVSLPDGEDLNISKK